jgi:hypothetical protein
MLPVEDVFSKQVPRRNKIEARASVIVEQEPKLLSTNLHAFFKVVN